ncbi:MAG: right-handed parallel beta-helix repeat-containing protein [Planctomycetota bacterium]|nr:right-handed parallel beta-helix repeat-containing protein [Planctomycetota bacterium]
MKKKFLNHPIGSVLRDPARRPSGAARYRVTLILWLLIAGCDGPAPQDPVPPVTEKSILSQEPTTAPRVAPPIDGVNQPPLFDGPHSVIAGDGSLHIEWQEAIDDHTDSDQIHYQIFRASRPGKQQFDQPWITTAPGATSHIIQNLPNGEAVYLVIRSFDGQGLHDFNESEWPVLPNPVMYVDAAAPGGGDGSSPENAFQKMDDAIGDAIGLAGVNIYVAAGRYQEQLLLFEGMAIYGGFPGGFSGPSSPGQHLTRLIGSPGQDGIIVPPGDQLVVIDGIQFDGGQQARRAMVADDCQIRISRCHISGFEDKGIQIETDLDQDGRVTGTIQSCTVSQNGGDGIRIEGHVDLAIRDCHLIDNQQSGLSVLPLLPRMGSKARIDMERCEVARNGDIGISIKIDAPLGAASDPARIRIGLRGVLVESNHDHGASFDIRYPEQSTVDLRIRAEHCSFISNHKAGLHLDADAAGDFSVLESEFLANLGSAGVRVDGDAEKALTRITSCFFGAQAGNGVRLAGKGLLDITRSLFIDNRSAAVSTSDTRQLKARMWACSGIGPAAVGIRQERVEIDPVGNDDRWQLLRVTEVQPGQLTVEATAASSFESGYLHHHRTVPSIAITGQEQTGPLKVSAEDSARVDPGSCWLWNRSSEIPSWTQYLDHFAVRWESTLSAPAGFLRPGVDRSFAKTMRPISYTSIEPPPGTIAAGDTPRWFLHLSESLPKTPKLKLTIDGEPTPILGEFDGKSGTLSCSATLSAGQRVRLEWTPDVSPATGDPHRFSHEWLVAPVGDH